MIEDTENQIINYLKFRNSPITKAEMFRYCHAENESEQRKVRHIIKKIRDVPVGSSHEGYFICRNKRELDIANNNDIKKIKAHVNNIKQRKYTYANYNTDVMVRSVSDFVKSWHIINCPELRIEKRTQC